MTTHEATDEHQRTSLVRRFAPGLHNLTEYRREWLRHDLAAGLSVAAVAMPTAIAYAQLVGFEPVVGLYAAILPLVAYAIFGTSRHLIVNPDAATCAMVGVILLPLAGENPDTLVALSVVLAVFTGLCCIVGGICRLGFLADFLSKPILVGFLNGIAIHIFLGQIGKVFGFSIKSHGIIPNLIEFLGKLPQTHGPTLFVGVLSLAVILTAKRWLPRWPAPLLAVVVAVALVRGLGLDDRGVAVVGDFPSGLPRLRWPEIDPQFIKPLLGGALGVGLLSFSNAMAVARSFAAKHGYQVDADREFFALGACQIAAGISQGFPVSAAGSRTAVNHAMGGKSQVAGLTAAAVMVVVLLFFTKPLGLLPMAALGAILIVAASGLVEVKELRHIWKVSRTEFVIAMITTVGVVALDVSDGILLAVGIALVMTLLRAARPPDAVLGRVSGLRGFHNVAAHEMAETLPGLVLYRFGSALVFFNALYFKKRVSEVVTAHPGVRWLIVDGSPINAIDCTGADTLQALADDLRQRGVMLGFANLRTELRAVLERANVTAVVGSDAIFPTLKSAVQAFEAREPDRT